jgi:serine/threonine-protein kinase RsbW
VGDTIRLDLPATHKYLNVLSACLAEMLTRVEDTSDLETIVYNVQLAVHEGCTNIVDHAYEEAENGRINVTLTLENHRLVVELQDAGRAFNPDAVPEPRLDEPQVHGYGLFLMRSLMDEVTYSPQPGNNRWRLIKNL